MMVEPNGGDLWANVLHATATGADSKACGDRVPAIYTKPSPEPGTIKLRVASCVNENANFVKDVVVAVRKWNRISIGQEIVGERYKVKLDETRIHTRVVGNVKNRYQDKLEIT